MDEQLIGRHEEAITTLKDEVKALREDIGEIKHMLALQQGGWKALVGIGTAAGAIGALVFSAISTMKGGG